MQQVDILSLEELTILAKHRYEPLVKAVVVVKKRIMVIDAELHADEELFLLERGSEQCDLWGINLWPGDYGSDPFVEFDSLINIRPSQNNRSHYVEDPAAREAILALVREVVYE